MLALLLLACAHAPPAPPPTEAELAPPPAPSQDLELAAYASYEEAMARFEALDAPGGRAALEQILAVAPGSRVAPMAERALEEAAVVGSPAPPWAVAEWFQGGPPEGARATLLVFWEVWCPHCQDELPGIDARAEAWRARGLHTVGLTRLTRDATPEAVRAFLALTGITIPIGREQDGAMAEAYRVTGIPAAALVRDGVIVWRGHPARITPALLDAVLGPVSEPSPG